MLSAQELHWLRSPASEEAEFNREALRLYLTESTCRRRRLTAIMDGSALSCEEQAESRRCDLCEPRAEKAVSRPADFLLAAAEQGAEQEAGQGAEQATIAVPEATRRAEEQAQRYASGPRLWRQRMQQQSAERQRIEEAMREIGDRCAACWLRGVESPAHRTGDCAWLPQQLGEGYENVRKRIRLEKGCYCCFLCGLPGDWCEDYSQGRRCRQTNVVVPLTLAAWGTPAGRAWLVGEARSERLEGVIQWMGQRAMIGGSRGSNTVRGAEAAIRIQRP